VQIDLALKYNLPVHTHNATQEARCCKKYEGKRLILDFIALVILLYEVEQITGMNFF
jgi:hypothetical protein